MKIILMLALVIAVGILLSLIMTRKRNTTTTTTTFRIESGPKVKALYDPNVGNMLRQTELMRKECLSYLGVIESKNRWANKRLLAENIAGASKPVAEQAIVFHNSWESLNHGNDSAQKNQLRHLWYECCALLMDINKTTEILLRHLSYDKADDIEELCEKIHRNLQMVLNSLAAFTQETAFYGKSATRASVHRDYKKPRTTQESPMGSRFDTPAP